MKIPTFRCPHCNNDLGTAVDAYLYGSPFRTCGKCKKTYVDRRYHEIAIEGIRREDVNPTDDDRKKHRKSGATALWLGIGAMVLFVLILFTGWIVFPLPIFGVISIIGGIGTLKGDSEKELEKTRKALELEQKQSMLRMQNPQYVAQLQAAGYNVPAAYRPQPAAPQSCHNCGAALSPEDKFCPTCGTAKQ